MDNLDAVWGACRWANQYVAVLAAVCVFYRLSVMALDKPRWHDARAQHLLGWFTYIALGLLVAALGASHYNAGSTPANWTSGARLCLTAAAICLSLWWPHPAKYVHVEEGSR